MECDEDLISMQAERELYYKKQQLIKQVQTRRDKKINELRLEVEKVCQQEKRKRDARKRVPPIAYRHRTAAAVDTADNPPVATSPSSSSVIDLVSSSESDDEGSQSPSKRPRAMKKPNRLPPPTPPDGTFIPGRIVTDTPLIRLLLRLQQEHHGDVSVYPPPCCDSNRCGYSTGCLHSQRKRLAKRLIEIECVLYGKHPENYILD